MGNVILSDIMLYHPDSLDTSVELIVVYFFSAVIEADKSVLSQGHIINLSEGSPHETIHSYISF